MNVYHLSLKFLLSVPFEKYKDTHKHENGSGEFRAHSSKEACPV